MATKIINPIEYAKLYGTHKSLIHRWLKNKKKPPLVESVTRKGDRYLLEVPDNLNKESLARFRRVIKNRKVNQNTENGYFDWSQYHNNIL